jgi:hypothetical protein
LAPPPVAAVPAKFGPLITFCVGQLVDEVKEPLPPGQIETPVVIGTGFTVITIVEDKAGQVLTGAIGVKVRVTVPLAILGV